MLRSLRRRLALAVDPGGERRDAALRSIVHAAARAGARSLDAVVVDGVIRVALSGPEPVARPERSARLDQLAAALGLRVRFVRGPAVAQPRLDPDGRARVEFMGAVRFFVARVASRWQGALDDDDPEEVHALRGALRRLRAALGMLGDGADDPALRGLVGWAGELSALTGALRDLDVAVASLKGYAPDAAALAHARRVLLAARLRARDAMLAHLRRGDVTATLRAATTSETPPPDAPRGRARKVAGRALARGLTRLERALDGDLSRPEGYHRVRRRARRVRDLVEVAGGALRRAPRRWRQRLHGLQAQLGDLHDADVLLGLLAEADDRALDALRAAVERRRAARVAGLAPSLDGLAAELRDR